jgi:hypothetical protein
MVLYATTLPFLSSNMPCYILRFLSAFPPSCTLPLSLTHTHSLLLSLSHTHSLSYSLSLSLSLSHTLSHSLDQSISPPSLSSFIHEACLLCSFSPISTYGNSRQTDRQTDRQTTTIRANSKANHRKHANKFLQIFTYTKEKQIDCIEYFKNNKQSFRSQSEASSCHLRTDGTVQRGQDILSFCFVWVDNCMCAYSICRQK